jgi:hypothetical protein
MTAIPTKPKPHPLKKILKEKKIRRWELIAEMGNVCSDYFLSQALNGLTPMEPHFLAKLFIAIAQIEKRRVEGLPL